LADPIIVPAIGGVAGAFATQLAGAAGAWLRERFSGHTELAYQRAHNNSEAFIINLSNRLQNIENSMAEDQSIVSKMGQAMEHPDVAAAIQDALYSAARTNDPQKHDLLSRAITERMLSDHDGVQALATNQALSVIPRLSPIHLDALGLTTLVYSIRPTLDSAIPPKTIARELEFWLASQVSLYLPIDDVSYMDAKHLMSNGCLIFQGNFSNDLKRVLSPDGVDDFEWTSDGFFESELGQKLQSAWGSFGTHCQLTSVGEIIGIYVHDSKSGRRTEITW